MLVPQMQESAGATKLYTAYQKPKEMGACHCKVQVILI